VLTDSFNQTTALAHGGTSLRDQRKVFVVFEQKHIHTVANSSTLEQEIRSGVRFILLKLNQRINYK